MNKYRTHNCSELTERENNKIVTLSGWIHRKRDHGNLLFIDLRDHFGLTQCVIENKNKFFKILEKIRPESVISITGKVLKREKGTENLELTTGKIEVSIQTIKILAEANDGDQVITATIDLAKVTAARRAIPSLASSAEFGKTRFYRR